MQQLWLNHKRIDSINQLRGLLEEASAEQSDGLCLALLELSRNGVLAAWLGRQHESTGYSMDQETEKLTAAIRTLRDKSRSDAVLYEALAVLTGLPASRFAADYVQKLRNEVQSVYSRKLTLLKAQPWWNTHQETFCKVKPQDWTYVVMDNCQLQVALEALRSDSTVMRTLYICNTDGMAQKLYLLDLRGLENVTIVGIEAPRVQYYWYAEQETIDLQKNRLYLRDLNIRFHQQDCLTNLQGYSTNFSTFRD